MATAHPAADLHHQALGLQQAGRPAEALAIFDQALALAPGHGGLHYDRALTLWALGRSDDALVGFQTAIRLKPDMAAAHYNRAVVLQRMGRLPEAMAGFDAALAIKPDLAEAWNNRAGILQEAGRDQEALDSIDRAMAIKPGNAASHYNRGVLLLSLYRLDEAMAALAQALALDPSHVGALGLMVSSAVRGCDWARVAQLSPRLLAEIASGKSAVPPLTLIAFCDDPVLQKSCAQANLALLLSNTAVPADPEPKWKGRRYDHDRLRIAYLSTDLRDHPVGAQIVPLLEHHDRSRFEIIGIFLGASDESRTHRRIVRACDQVHSVWDKGDEDVARLIRDLEVDVLVDLNGQTYGWRPGILKYRAAPVQALYLGYAGTTGADFIDYIIADAVVAPFASQAHYSEKIVHLPDCFWPADPSPPALPALSRAEAGLPPDGFVFCCFNAHWKISAEIFGVWMRLLAAVPGSVLWLRDAKDDSKPHLIAAAREAGIDPDRIVWAGRAEPFEMHLARHTLADLFLDAFPYNAHVTASDALKAGLPLVTLRGHSFVSRVAASFLAALELDELVTASLGEYEALALALATDPTRLASIRDKLERNRVTKPLFDAPRLARGIEAAYVEMTARARRGEKPAPFAVPPR